MSNHRYIDLKRIHIRDACYFVTIKTRGNYPFFKETFLCDLFIEELRLCKCMKSFKLYGWVICHDHAHLMIRPGGRWNISEIMFSIKKQFSHNANRIMGYASIHTLVEKHPIPVGTHPIPVGTHPIPVGLQALASLRTKLNQPFDHPRLRDMGIIPKIDFHHFDTFVENTKKQFQNKHRNKSPFPKFQWQKSFYDHYCRNETDFLNCLEYIAHNPIKHNLPKNWPYVFTNPNYGDLTDSS